MYVLDGRSISIMQSGASHELGRDPSLTLRMTGEDVLLVGRDTFRLDQICELLASELYYPHSFQTSKTGLKVGSNYANITTSSCNS